MTVNYYLNNDLRSKYDEKSIFAYVRGLAKGKTIVLNTGERINPKYWNIEKQQAKVNYTGSPELNEYLTAFKEKIKKVVRETLTENIDLEFDEIKTAILSAFNKSDNKSNFFEVFKLFLELRKTELSEGMIKKYKVLQNHLQDFEKDTNYKISFNSIDLMFYDRFSNYLLTVKQHTNNTVSKYFDILKTFLHWSSDRKVNKNFDYLKFKSKNDKTDLIYLTEKELMTLFELDLKDNTSLEQVRDVFCFGCFTGQRFSDVSAIKRDDIKNNFWHLRIVKTRDILKVPLNEYAKEILNKYAENDKPLPIISNQKTNEYLKTVCEKAKINDRISIVRYRGSEQIEETFSKYEMVSTHTARRTFVTLSLEKGMRPETVMEITGHKDYKTFKKYIKLTSSVKAVEMNKIWKKEPTLKVVKAG